MTLDPREAYGRLEQVFARAATLRSVQGLLDWDCYVALPKAASEARGRQAAVMGELLNETLGDPRLADWVDAAENADLDVWQSANLREMRRDLSLNAASPKDLNRRMAEASATCEMAWRSARAASNFAMVRPYLENLFGVASELACARGQALGLREFDAMMEIWEPGARCADLDGHFDKLARVLPGLMESVASRSLPIDASADPLCSSEELLNGLRAVAAHLGLDPASSRLDPASQPFFMDDNPDDTRIGVRLQPGRLTPCLMGLIHEIGHARHECNSPPAWRGQPVGRPRSAAIQESQALLLEKMVGRSDGFWRATGPVLSDALNQTIDWRKLSALSQRVTPSPIRVEADAVSYGLHIVLRYRLERDLIEKQLSVSDLPEAWNEAFRGLFGFAPANDAEGCLQDIHWHRGLLGYFPSYAQGQWAAAQFAEAAERDHPHLWEEEDGCGALADWVHEHVHAQGSLLETESLMKQATGATLSPDAFLRHVSRKYLCPAEPCPGDRDE